MRKDMQTTKNFKGKAKTLLILSMIALWGSGCTTSDRWVNHKKEHGGPFPTKYEVPFTQVRQEKEQEKIYGDSRDTEIPTPIVKTPEVIEPENWAPNKETILFGIVIKGDQENVLSPYAPDKGLVNVRGYPYGTIVRDPFTGKSMRVPDIVKPAVETLQTPSEDTPEVPFPEVAPPPTLEP